MIYHELDAKSSHHTVIISCLYHDSNDILLYCPTCMRVILYHGHVCTFMTAQLKLHALNTDLYVLYIICTLVLF